MQPQGYQLKDAKTKELSRVFHQPVFLKIARPRNYLRPGYDTPNQKPVSVALMAKPVNAILPIAPAPKIGREQYIRSKPHQLITNMSKNYKYLKRPEPALDVLPPSIRTHQNTKTATSALSPRIFPAFTTTFPPGKVGFATAVL